jgi:Tfp pilus assembly PilM family ATPase
MLIAMTLLENHLDALLLKDSNGGWDIIEHAFIAKQELVPLCRRWRKNSRRVAVGLNHQDCHYHQFQIENKIDDATIKKYIDANASLFFGNHAKQLSYDFERHKNDDKTDQIHCLAISRETLKQTIRLFKKTRLKLCLIDSSLNALLRGLEQQHDASTESTVIETHLDQSTTQNYPTEQPLDTIDRIYCINTPLIQHPSAQFIQHQPGSLATYGLALNAHLN